MDYKWDLTRIFKDENEYNNCVLEINNLISDIGSYKGRIFENEKVLLELLELEVKISKLLNKLYVYSYLGFYDNMGDVRFQQYKENASALASKVSSATSFIVPEILSSEFSLIEDYINKNEKLELYRRSLEIIFREKEHILSEKEEKILSDLSEVTDVMSDAYDSINDIDSYYGKIKDENNNSVELTSSNYSLFLTSKNVA